MYSLPPSSPVSISIVTFVTFFVRRDTRLFVCSRLVGQFRCTERGNAVLATTRNVPRKSNHGRKSRMETLPILAATFCPWFLPANRVTAALSLIADWPNYNERDTRFEQRTISFAYRPFIVANAPVSCNCDARFPRRVALLESRRSLRCLFVHGTQGGNR